MILKAISHTDIVSQYLDVYDLVKIGNINLSPNIHFYEVGGEFLSNQINNVKFLTKHLPNFIDVDNILVANSGGITISDPITSNTYISVQHFNFNGITYFYYSRQETSGAPFGTYDCEILMLFRIKFNGDSIPDDFLSEFVNTDCVMTIENAGSIMKIGNNVFAKSEFSNIIANFTGIREIGSNVKLAKTGGTITTENPLGLGCL